VTSDLSYFGKAHINWSPTLYKSMDAKRHFDTHWRPIYGAASCQNPRHQTKPSQWWTPRVLYSYLWLLFGRFNLPQDTKKS